MPLFHYAIKVALSAGVIVAVAEIAKRSSFWAAALASLPLTSLLAFVWLYLETGDIQKITTLAQGIFWLVIPSLLLFVLLLQEPKPAEPPPPQPPPSPEPPKSPKPKLVVMKRRRS